MTHKLITDHNGDPRCSCDWQPRPKAPGIAGQLRAADEICRHASTWRFSTKTRNHDGGLDYTFKRVSNDGLITSLHTVPVKDFWRAV